MKFFSNYYRLESKEENLNFDKFVMEKLFLSQSWSLIIMVLICLVAQKDNLVRQQ